MSIGVPSAMCGMSSTGTILATRHLVAGLQATLHGEIDLHHLLHPGRQLVAAGELLLLLLESRIELHALLGEAVLQLLELILGLVGREPDVEPRVALDVVQVRLGDLGALRKLLRAAIRGLVEQQALDTRERVGFHDAELIAQVGLVALQLVIDDLLGAFVALDAFAGKHLHVDDRA